MQKKLSNHAQKCPNCACPIEVILKTLKDEEAEKKAQKIIREAEEAATKIATTKQNGS